MIDTQLQITFAGPLVSLQDAGRTGGLRFGVSPSGPMDREAFAAAHAALGNPAGGTAIEVSLGGLALRATTAPVTIAITGGAFEVDHAGVRGTSNQVLTLNAGETLTVRGGASGSWAYIAVAGTIDAPRWMNSTACHSMSVLGGPAIMAGGELNLRGAQVRPTRIGILPPAPVSRDPVRVVLGPQDHHFAPNAVETFLTQPYKISTAYDRMGMRLEGPKLPLGEALSIPSEPILRGAVQVAGNGVPTVLLADHQSTGGYPKIATVLSVDTDRLSQYRAGDRVSFVAVTAQEALTATRDHAAVQTRYLAQLAQPRGTLADRLMRENLIHVAEHLIPDQGENG